MLWRAVTATIQILQMQFLSPIFESSLLIELGFKYVSYRVSKRKILFNPLATYIAQKYKYNINT